MDEFDEVRRALISHPDNAWATQTGFAPLYTAHPDARCLIVGQAPGRKAQASGIAWNDASGQRLIDWLGVDEGTFRTPAKFAILPMDFYFPGKGAVGDLPPRAEFARVWHPRLLALMPNIRLTLLIGGYAQRYC